MATEPHAPLSVRSPVARVGGPPPNALVVAERQPIHPPSIAGLRRERQRIHPRSSVWVSALFLTFRSSLYRSRLYPVAVPGQLDTVPFSTRPLSFAFRLLCGLVARVLPCSRSSQMYDAFALGQNSASSSGNRGRVFTDCRCRTVCLSEHRLLLLEVAAGANPNIDPRRRRDRFSLPLAVSARVASPRGKRAARPRPRWGSESGGWRPRGQDRGSPAFRVSSLEGGIVADAAAYNTKDDPHPGHSGRQRGQ
jgi:hypothetical protein